jgi:hypothetical protein
MPHAFKPDPPRRTAPGSRPLADLVGPSIRPVLGKQGFGGSDILMHWPEIVGVELAEHCHPLRLQWRRGSRETSKDPATLVVRVESASALRLQHMESVILDRVNTYLGWRCIGRLALRQGPLPQRARPAHRRFDVDEPALAEARRSVADLVEPDLRDALARLGARVLGRRRLPEN